MTDDAGRVDRGVVVTPEEALNNAYHERNAVIAAMIRTNGWRCWVINAPDAEGWYIVYADTPQGQVSWHVSAADIVLFADAKGAPLFDSAGPEWDGHTTEEKYRRLALCDAERAGAGRLREAARRAALSDHAPMFAEGSVYRACGCHVHAALRAALDAEPGQPR